MDDPTDPKALARLGPLLGGNVVVVAVGNPLRGDDGVAAYLGARLRTLTPWPVIDAGQAPENFTDKIAALRPQTVLLLDAGDWGGAPGDARLLADREVDTGAFSTHGPTLGLFVPYLKARLDAAVWVLAIQVQDTSLGRPLSPEVQARADSLARALAADGLSTLSASLSERGEPWAP